VVSSSHDAHTHTGPGMTRVLYFSFEVHVWLASRMRLRLAFIPQGACAPVNRRTKSLKTVATRVVTGISHRIVLFCEKYLLVGVRNQTPTSIKMET